MTSASPDRTPSDILSRSWTKQGVYRSEPRILDELEQTISTHFTGVSLVCVRKSVKSVSCGLQVRVCVCVCETC